MENKKKKKDKTKIRDKKSLKIVNWGDTVIIRRRCAFGKAFRSLLFIAIPVGALLMFESAWESTVLRAVLLLLFLCSIYSFISAVFSKIFLDSPGAVMTVFSPFKAEYKFSDINYVDLKSSKPKDGIITHTVTAYIGDGRRKVELTTCSKPQADELLSLLRGMLDNAAMEYPEGNEEPFRFDDENEESGGFLKRKKQPKHDEEKADTEKPDEEKTDNVKSDGEKTDAPISSDKKDEEKDGKTSANEQSEKQEKPE